MLFFQVIKSEEKLEEQEIHMTYGESITNKEVKSPFQKKFPTFEA